MNPLELTVSVTAFANAIAANYTTEELELIAAVFTQLGDTLSVIAIQRERCSDKIEKAEQMDKKY